ncbi:MAG: ATP-binding cassette domain-containing protein [Acholeplasmatales bacterium]|jgi:oligopeptide transport system ATP-binding protein|nr:ATP-binding cassette domain-containing protein [Acholeplasmatales bacterium]
MEKKIAISVKDLAVSFRTNQGLVHAVRGVSFDLYKGETLAIVGESGSGKSVSSRSIMGILAGNAIIENGKILYDNQDLIKIPEEEFHKIRGNKIGMIFQDPTSSLNPIMRVGKQITEAMLLNGKRKKNKIDLSSFAELNSYNNALSLFKSTKSDKELKSSEKKEKLNEIKKEIKVLKLNYTTVRKSSTKSINEEFKVLRKDYYKDVKEIVSKHSLKEIGTIWKEYLERRDTYLRNIKVTKREAFDAAIKIMEEVGIPEPQKRFKMYPFQFSGGMKQRIVIAIALMAQPEILICDEPTTALDVTIQAQILELIKTIKKNRDLSVIFITHNLGVVANVADRIAVMYAGKIVEYGTADDIFYNPRHPYTWALMNSMPDLNSKEKLSAIPGTPPNMLYPPKGDAFAVRNKYALKIDYEEQPPLFQISDSHFAATWLLFDHPSVPKIGIPEDIIRRIENVKLETERLRGEKNEHI